MTSFRVMMSSLPSPTLSLLLLLALLAHAPRHVGGHGRLVEPPARSTLWRFGYAAPHNYEDNQLFCGGVAVQYSARNKGKCGVCGDPWDQPAPRDHEPGGRFHTGIIVRHYNVGATINVTVDLTANHQGWFEFRLCRTDDPNHHVTHACLDRNLLEMADGTGTRYSIPKETLSSSKQSMSLRLPQGLKCKACVLQWKYNAGNSWGTNADGTGCVGCGNQEQFYGCADVAIGHPEVKLGVPQAGRGGGATAGGGAMTPPAVTQANNNGWQPGVTSWGTVSGGVCQCVCPGGPEAPVMAGRMQQAQDKTNSATGAALPGFMLMTSLTMAATLGAAGL